MLDVTYTLTIQDDITSETLLTKTGNVAIKDEQEFAVRVSEGITAGSCTLKLHLASSEEIKVQFKLTTSTTWIDPALSRAQLELSEGSKTAFKVGDSV